MHLFLYSHGIIDSYVDIDFWFGLLKRREIKVITFSDERKYWESEEEMSRFLTESIDVDRIYYYAANGSISAPNICFLLRTHYRRRPLYVEIMYFDNRLIKSSIILTYDTQRFMDSIISSYNERETIFKKVFNDDINIQRSWNNVSSLERLCCLTMGKYWNTLTSVLSVPRLIRNSIDNTLQAQEIENRYERKIFKRNMQEKYAKRLW